MSHSSCSCEVWNKTTRNEYRAALSWVSKMCVKSNSYGRYPKKAEIIDQVPYVTRLSGLVLRYICCDFCTKYITRMYSGEISSLSCDRKHFVYWKLLAELNFGAHRSVVPRLYPALNPNWTSRKLSRANRSTVNARYRIQARCSMRYRIVNREISLRWMFNLTI
jgi:hypothetical protein